MNFLVQEATDETTAGNQEHRDHCGGAVDRAECKIAVIKNGEWSDDTEDHMNAEPVADLPQDLQKLESLSEGVEQQRQDQKAANDAQRIAKSMLGKQATRITPQVTNNDGYCGQQQSSVTTPLLI